MDSALRDDLDFSTREEYDAALIADTAQRLVNNTPAEIYATTTITTVVEIVFTI